MSVHSVESMLQTIYNLNWKGRGQKDETPDWVSFDSGHNKIVIYPTAADYTTPNEEHPIQVKWEIFQSHGERLINMTIKKPQYLSGIESILKEYLGYV